MLKRLRWKFTGAAMLAVFIVLSVLVVCINLVYRRVTVEGEERILTVIAENNGEIPPYAPRRQEGEEPWGFHMTPETRFETRFFVVWEDADEKQMDFIAAVTGKDAEAYYRQAEESGADAGFIGQYRFRRFAGENGSFYVFHDCDRQLRSVQNLARVSAIATLASLLVIFALVWLLSGVAIRPTLQGIERQKRFITDASHELKTPLAVIRSYADVLCMEDGDSEWAQGIRRESARMTRLVSDLVLLSRWDEEAPITEKLPFDLSRALWDTLTPYQNLAETDGKRFEASIDEDLTLTGDEGAIQTAFTTLLENAVQYSLPESTIEFSAKRERRHIAARIVNRCELPDTLDPNRLFDRFYRADPSRARDSGGTGVGLSIAKAIIEAHGGKIRAARSDPQTICFSISLPSI